MDAVALLALSMQKRFGARPDKNSIRLPVATPANNHRAVWLGGGGIGKTRTFNMVVQPLAETFFGPEGYCATAHSNQAAQNLGSKGRTLHSANGLLQTDSLQTARLRLNPQTQKRMDRLTSTLGVDVIDELGAVPGDLLHSDALRKTYGRCLRHNLDTTAYMKPAETWGRMHVASDHQFARCSGVEFVKQKLIIIVIIRGAAFSVTAYLRFSSKTNWPEP